MPEVNKLDDDQLTQAFKRVDVWLHDRETSVPCVTCETPGLDIDNQSVPPYSEWYQLRCDACGLDTIISRQMGFARWIDPL